MHTNRLAVAVAAALSFPAFGPVSAVGELPRLEA
jgi:hypothetical protein